MRVLVVHAHPDPQSYGAALHETAVAALREAGHQVDDCDLYAEGFDPVMSCAERRGYHAVPQNRSPVAGHVERLLAAEALVLSFPVWNYGYPAMMKGYFDRVFLPGVSFRMSEGTVRPNLTNIRKLTAITTYGGSRLRTMLMGDPPRKLVCRGLRVVCHPMVSLRYLAHYDMNRATPESRTRFLERVRRQIGRI